MESKNKFENNKNFKTFIFGLFGQRFIEYKMPDFYWGFWNLLTAKGTF